LVRLQSSWTNDTRLAAGDVLMVTRLDRLARSTRDLLNMLTAMMGTGAGFTSLGDAWADTTTPDGRLMLTVLGVAYLSPADIVPRPLSCRLRPIRGPRSNDRKMCGKTPGINHYFTATVKVTS